MNKRYAVLRNERFLTRAPHAPSYAAARLLVAEYAALEWAHVTWHSRHFASGSNRDGEPVRFDLVAV